MFSVLRRLARPHRLTQPGGPSRTSQVVAVTRAGLDRPHTPGGDPRAQRRLCRGMRPAAGRGVQAQPGRQDPVLRRVSVLEAISAGTGQVVILGAGYDDRALRFRSPGVRFFELDHPATQADKARRLRAIKAGAGAPVLAPADFRHGDVAAVLGACGHDAGQPTLFLCEGLLVYLDRPTCVRLLTAPACPGRRRERPGRQPGRPPRAPGLRPGRRRGQRPAPDRRDRAVAHDPAARRAPAAAARVRLAGGPGRDAAELGTGAEPGRSLLVTARPAAAVQPSSMLPEGSSAASPSVHPRSGRLLGSRALALRAVEDVAGGDGPGARTPAARARRHQADRGPARDPAVQAARPELRDRRGHRPPDRGPGRPAAGRRRARGRARVRLAHAAAAGRGRPGDRGRGRSRARGRAAAHGRGPRARPGRAARGGDRRRGRGCGTCPGPPPTALVANLPYNVAVPVVLHLLATLPSLRRGLVMVQAEVADRMSAAARQQDLRRAVGQAGLVRGRPAGGIGVADGVLAGAAGRLRAGRVHPAGSAGPAAGQPRPQPRGGLRRGGRRVRAAAQDAEGRAGALGGLPGRGRAGAAGGRRRSVAARRVPGRGRVRPDRRRPAGNTG